MIKLTWMELANPQFQDAARVIWDCPMLDARTSYTASRIHQGIEAVNREIRDLRVTLINKYAKKMEDGVTTLTDARGMVQFESEEKTKEFEAEFQKEFTSRSLELKVSKINFQALGDVRGIAPRQWEFLTPILENLPPTELNEAPKEDDPSGQVLQLRKENQ